MTPTTPTVSPSLREVVADLIARAKMTGLYTSRDLADATISAVCEWMVSSPEVDDFVAKQLADYAEKYGVNFDQLACIATAAAARKMGE